MEIVWPATGQLPWPAEKERKCRERNLNKNEISLVFTMQIANCTHQPPPLMRNAK